MCRKWKLCEFRFIMGIQHWANQCLYFWSMAVLMVTGNAAVIPDGPLVSVRTMTATIAAEMGDTVHGSPHYRALFAIGAVLFAITLIVNGAASAALHRARRNVEGRA